MHTGLASAALQEAAARVGDRWTLLVIAALLGGPRRFGALLDALPGVAPNVLSRRLKQLEADGLVVAAPYSRRPVRVEYRVTAAGAGLASALRVLAQWGAERSVPHQPALPHAECGTGLEARWWCPTCARVVDDEEAGELRWL